MNLVDKIRAYLLRTLAPKKIMALQLEKFVLKSGPIQTVTLDFSTGYNSVTVHYVGDGINHVFYDENEREMALRDFLFIYELFKGQKKERKAK